MQHWLKVFFLFSVSFLKGEVAFVVVHFLGLFLYICVFPIKTKSHKHRWSLSLFFLLVYRWVSVPLLAVARLRLFLLYFEGNCETRGLPRREHNWFRSQNFLWKIFCVYFPFDFPNFCYYHFVIFFSFLFFQWESLFLADYWLSAVSKSSSFFPLVFQFIIHRNLNARKTQSVMQYYIYAQWFGFSSWNTRGVLLILFSDSFYWKIESNNKSIITGTVPPPLRLLSVLLCIYTVFLNISFSRVPQELKINNTRLRGICKDSGILSLSSFLCGSMK